MFLLSGILFLEFISYLRLCSSAGEKGNNPCLINAN